MKKQQQMGVGLFSTLMLCLAAWGATRAQQPPANMPPAHALPGNPAAPATPGVDTYETVSVGTGGGNGGGWRSPLYGLSYLNIPEVQEELKLTRDQIAYLKRAPGQSSSYSQAMEQVGGQARMAADPAARMLFYRLLTSAERSIVADTLSEVQIKRHREICIQWEGIGALRRQDVADALGLTTEQRAKIGAYGMERESQMRAHFANRTPATPVTTQRTARPVKDAVWEEFRLKCRVLLTPAQLKQWQEMNGPVFKWLAHSRGQDLS